MRADAVERVHDGAAFEVRLFELVDETFEARVEAEVEEEIKNLHCSETGSHSPHVTRGTWYAST